MTDRTLALRPGSGRSTPRAVVIGAGIVGLSTAWFLQERGVEVVVVERSGVAAGSSWGNAGWLSPGLSIPLAEPGILRYGIQEVFKPDSPLYVPLRLDAHLIRFMVGFARHCTMRTWNKTMAHYVPVNQRALAAYDELAAGGVDAPTHVAPILAAFRRRADAADLETEVEHIRAAGLALETAVIDGDALREQVPIVAPDVETAIRIDGQRYLNPGQFVGALARSVHDRGGRVRTGATVSAIRPGPAGLAVEMFGGEPESADAVVVATGAWLPALARTYGVRVPLRAGRGYSFDVAVESPVPCPVYFAKERVACTPLDGRLRVAGTMEFRATDAPLDPDRVRAIVRSARPLMTGVDWDDLRGVWVGSRPVTVDSLPVVGATRAPGIFVAGGHGMWGISLGPITGKLLAERIVSGTTPEPLRPFDPLR